MRLESNPGIVSLKKLVINQKSIILIMDYNNSVNLKYFLQKNRLPLSRIKMIFRQVLEIIQDCHKSLVAHRDIKLENILIDSALNVQVIDFGYSEVMENQNEVKKYFSCGTLNYIAPEVLIGKPFNGKI